MSGSNISRDMFPNLGVVSSDKLHSPDTTYWPEFDGIRGGALREEFAYFASCALRGEAPAIGRPGHVLAALQATLAAGVPARAAKWSASTTRKAVRGQTDGQESSRCRLGNMGMSERSLTRGFPASRWSVSVKGGSPTRKLPLSSATMQAKLRTAGGWHQGWIAGGGSRLSC